MRFLSTAVYGALIGIIPSIASSQTGPDLRGVTDGLAGQIPPLASALTVAAFIFGVSFIFIGLFKFKKSAERPGDDASRPFVALIFIFAGAGIIALPTTITTGIGSIFGADVPTATSYGGGTQVLPFTSRKEY